MAFSHLAQLHAFVVEGGKWPEGLAIHSSLRVCPEGAGFLDPIVNLCLVWRHGNLNHGWHLHITQRDSIGASKAAPMHSCW